GRKGKRKKKKNTSREEAQNHDGVSVSRLEVVLVEGESNIVRDQESRAYRIEAERLFNIGINMGATTNEERISMIERLMDLEEKEVNFAVDLGDDEVDP
ncbi:hypothetical protein A2U01_0065108, partial [Trifolium medium]|nr:hypothetical protein [Trifolium medium]